MGLTFLSKKPRLFLKIPALFLSIFLAIPSNVTEVGAVSAKAPADKREPPLQSHHQIFGMGGAGRPQNGRASPEPSESEAGYLAGHAPREKPSVPPKARLASGGTQTPHAQSSNVGARSPRPEEKGGETPPLQIPQELGTIEEFHRGTSGRTVIYIQDAHDSLEAQENIAKMASHLVEEYGVKTVFTEGYEGPVPTDEYFGFIKDPVLKEKLAYFLMDQLRLGGAEYAHLLRTKAFELIGADSLRAHIENIRAYQKHSQYQKQVQKDLEALEKEIQKLADRSFPPPLKEWMKLKEKLDGGKLALPDYLRRVPWGYSYDQINRSGIFFGGTNFTRSPEQREGRRVFPDAILNVGADPRVRPFAGDARGSGSTPTDLLRKIHQIETAFAQRNLRNARDVKIFDYYRKLALLKRLNAFEISFEEYQAVRDVLGVGARHAVPLLKTDSLADFIFAQTRKSLVLSKEWEETIQSAIRFYDLALEREQAIEKALVENVGADPRVRPFAGDTQGIGSTHGSTPTNHGDMSVIVFGGFHTAGIKEILKKRGFSYYVVTPRITHPSKRHQDYYKRLMTVGYHPFEVGAGFPRPTFKGAGTAPLPIANARASAPLRFNRVYTKSELRHLAERAGPFRDLPREIFIRELAKAELPRSEAREENDKIVTLDKLDRSQLDYLRQWYLDRDLSLGKWKGLGQAGGIQIYVLLSKNKPESFIELERKPLGTKAIKALGPEVEVIQVSYIFTNPEKRGRDFAETLIYKAVEIAKENHINLLKIESDSKGEPFWLRMIHKLLDEDIVQTGWKISGGLIPVFILQLTSPRSEARQPLRGGEADGSPERAAEARGLAADKLEKESAAGRVRAESRTTSEGGEKERLETLNLEIAAAFNQRETLDLRDPGRQQLSARLQELRVQRNRILKEEISMDPNLPDAPVILRFTPDFKRAQMGALEAAADGDPDFLIVANIRTASSRKQDFFFSALEPLRQIQPGKMMVENSTSLPPAEIYYEAALHEFKTGLTKVFPFPAEYLNPRIFTHPVVKTGTDEKGISQFAFYIDLRPGLYEKVRDHLTQALSPEARDRKFQELFGAARPQASSLDQLRAFRSELAVWGYGVPGTENWSQEALILRSLTSRLVSDGFGGFNLRKDARLFFEFPLVYLHEYIQALENHKLRERPEHVQRVARRALDAYWFSILSLLSMRIWDEGADPNLRLEELQALLNELHRGGSRQMFMDKAVGLLDFGSSFYTGIEYEPSYVRFFYEKIMKLKPEHRRDYIQRSAKGLTRHVNFLSKVLNAQNVALSSGMSEQYRGYQPMMSVYPESLPEFNLEQNQVDYVLQMIDLLELMEEGDDETAAAAVAMDSRRLTDLEALQTFIPRREYEDFAGVRLDLQTNRYIHQLKEKAPLLLKQSLAMRPQRDRFSIFSIHDVFNLRTLLTLLMNAEVHPEDQGFGMQHLEYDTEDPAQQAWFEHLNETAIKIEPMPRYIEKEREKIYDYPRAVLVHYRLVDNLARLVLQDVDGFELIARELLRPHLEEREVNQAIPELKQIRTQGILGPKLVKALRSLTAVKKVESPSRTWNQLLETFEAAVTVDRRVALAKASSRSEARFVKKLTEEITDSEHPVEWTMAEWQKGPLEFGVEDFKRSSQSHAFLFTLLNNEEPVGHWLFIDREENPARGLNPVFVELSPALKTAEYHWSTPMAQPSVGPFHLEVRFGQRHPRWHSFDLFVQKGEQFFNRIQIWRIAGEKARGLIESQKKSFEKDELRRLFELPPSFPVRSEARGLEALKRQIFYDEENLSNGALQRIRSLVPGTILELKPFEQIHRNNSELSVVMIKSPDVVVRVKLVDRGENLHMGEGIIQGIPIQEFAAVKGQYEHFKEPFFAWWYENRILPFARALGYNSITIEHTYLHESTLRELGFQRLEIPVSSPYFNPTGPSIYIHPIEDHSTDDLTRWADTKSEVRTGLRNSVESPRDEAASPKSTRGKVSIFQAIAPVLGVLLITFLMVAGLWAAHHYFPKWNLRGYMAVVFVTRFLSQISASFIDKDHHPKRFLFGALQAFPAGLWVPVFTTILVPGIPDWFGTHYWLRTYADLLACTPLHILASALIMGYYNVPSQGKKGWARFRHIAQVKSGQIFGPGGLFGLALVFWTPITVSIYYLPSVMSELQLFVTIGMAVFQFFQALYLWTNPFVESASADRAIHWFQKRVLKYAWLFNILVIGIYSSNWIHALILFGLTGVSHTLVTKIIEPAYERRFMTPSIKRRAEMRFEPAEIHRQRYGALQAKKWYGVLTDIDYTLTDGEKKLSEKCLQKIAALLKQGVRVGLISGRVYNAGEAEAVDLESDARLSRGLDIKTQIVLPIQAALGPEHQDKLRFLDIFPEGAAYGFNAADPARLYDIEEIRAFSPDEKPRIIQKFRELFSVRRLASYHIKTFQQGSHEPAHPFINFKTRILSIGLLELPHEENSFVPDTIQEIKLFFKILGRDVEVVWGGEGFDILPKGVSKQRGVAAFARLLGSHQFVSLDDSGALHGNGEPLTNRPGGASPDQFNLEDPHTVSTYLAFGKKFAGGWLDFINGLEFVGQEIKGDSPRKKEQRRRSEARQAKLLIRVDHESKRLLGLLKEANAETLPAVLKELKGKYLAFRNEWLVLFRDSLIERLKEAGSDRWGSEIRLGMENLLKEITSALPPPNEAEIFPALTSDNVPKVAVIIPIYNRPNDSKSEQKKLSLQDNLLSLGTLHYPPEKLDIILIDNGSPDADFARQIKSGFPFVHIVRSSANLGFAGGNNLGIRLAKERGASYYFLINDDTYINDPNILRKLVDVSMRPGIGFVGMPLVNLRNGRWRITDALEFPAPKKEKRSSPRYQEVDCVAGSAFLVSERLVDQIGEMDDRFFLYFEELDWNIRASRQGLRNVLITTSRMVHKEEGGGIWNAKSAYYFSRNRIFFARRNYEDIYHRWIWPVTHTLRFMRRAFQPHDLQTDSGFQIGRDAIRGFLDGMMGRWERPPAYTISEIQNPASDAPVHHRSEARQPLRGGEADGSPQRAAEARARPIPLETVFRKRVPVRYPHSHIAYSQTPLDWQNIFRNKHPIHISIGSGESGIELNAAEGNPEVNYVLMELPENEDIDEKPGFKRGIPTPSKTEIHQQSNIRYVIYDAREAVRDIFQDSTVGRIYLVFPYDPDAPSPDHRYRLIRPDGVFVRTLFRKLKPGGEFWMVTEDRDYRGQVRNILKAHTNFKVKSGIVDSWNKKHTPPTLSLPAEIVLEKSKFFRDYKHQRDNARWAIYGLRAFKKAERVSSAFGPASKQFPAKSRRSEAREGKESEMQDGKMMTLLELLNIVFTKYGTRKLLQGFPGQPQGVKLLAPHQAISEGPMMAQLAGMLPEGARTDFYEIARYFAAGHFPYPLVFKPNALSDGNGIFFMNRSEGGKVTVKMIYFPIPRSEKPAKRFIFDPENPWSAFTPVWEDVSDHIKEVYADRFQKTDIERNKEENVITFTLDPSRIPVADTLYEIWKIVSRDLQNAGMVEEMLDLYKWRDPEGRDHAVETRYIGRINLSGISKDASNMYLFPSFEIFEEGFTDREPSFTRVGSSAEFANLIGRNQKRIQRLPGSRRYEPLKLSSEERLKIEEELEQQIDLIRRRVLFLAGIPGQKIQQSRERLRYKADAFWLKRRDDNEIPRFVVNELLLELDNLHPGSPLKNLKIQPKTFEEMLKAVPFSRSEARQPLRGGEADGSPQRAAEARERKTGFTSESLKFKEDESRAERKVSGVDDGAGNASRRSIRQGEKRQTSQKVSRHTKSSPFASPRLPVKKHDAQRQHQRYDATGNQDHQAGAGILSDKIAGNHRPQIQVDGINGDFGQILTLSSGKHRETHSTRQYNKSQIDISEYTKLSFDPRSEARMDPDETAQNPKGLTDQERGVYERHVRSIQRNIQGLTELQNDVRNGMKGKLGSAGQAVFGVRRVMSESMDPDVLEESIAGERRELTVIGKFWAESDDGKKRALATAIENLNAAITGVIDRTDLPSHPENQKAYAAVLKTHGIYYKILGLEEKKKTGLRSEVREEAVSMYRGVDESENRRNGESERQGNEETKKQRERGAVSSSFHRFIDTSIQVVTPAAKAIVYADGRMLAKRSELRREFVAVADRNPEITWAIFHSDELSPEAITAFSELRNVKFIRSELREAVAQYGKKRYKQIELVISVPRQAEHLKEIERFLITKEDIWAVPLFASINGPQSEFRKIDGVYRLVDETLRSRLSEMRAKLVIRTSA